MNTVVHRLQELPEEERERVLMRWCAYGMAWLAGLVWNVYSAVGLGFDVYFVVPWGAAVAWVLTDFYVALYREITSE